MSKHICIWTVSLFDGFIPNVPFKPHFLEEKVETLLESSRFVKVFDYVLIPFFWLEAPFQWYLKSDI